jgi:hypothetical protein
MIELAILVVVGFLFNMIKDGLQNIIEILEDIRNK